MLLNNNQATISEKKPSLVNSENRDYLIKKCRGLVSYKQADPELFPTILQPNSNDITQDGLTYNKKKIDLKKYPKN